jgi:hypothetical protein
MKECITCNKVKPLCDYHKAGNGVRRADCKVCRASNNVRNNPKGNAVSRLAYTLAGGSRSFYELPAEQRLELRTRAASLYDAGKDFTSAVQARQSRPDGFVYIIGHKCLSGLKIGRAFDPESRLKNYQTGCPNREYVIHYISEYNDDCVALEKRVHQLLDPVRLQGEWFGCTVEQARGAILRASKEIAA